MPRGRTRHPYRRRSAKQTDQVFYDPTIKCYDGNDKIDKTKAKSHTLSDKDYVKYHKFQEKQDTNYKKKNKNKFYVENVKCSQNQTKNTVKQSSNTNDNNNDDGKIKHSMTAPTNETFDACDEYIHLLQVIVYGYLRIVSSECNIFIPSDVKRLCYLWYHPNTTHLIIITETAQPFSIGIIPTETILDLKQKIEAKEGIYVKQQRLVQPNLGKTLLDKFHIAEYNLHNNDVLQLKMRK